MKRKQVRKLVRREIVRYHAMVQASGLAAAIVEKIRRHGVTVTEDPPPASAAPDPAAGTHTAGGAHG